MCDSLSKGECVPAFARESERTMPKRRANGEGNIRKRKDGRWEGRYTVGHDPETGKAIIKNVLGKTQAEAKKKPKGIAPKTVRNIHQMIGSAYNLAMEQKLVSKNPTQGCALPKVEHKEMKTLTADQLSAFFQEARDSGVYELYYLDLATGLRRGELLGLKWTDVDFDRGVLKIQRAISRQNGRVEEAPLKTKNAYRTLPLSADAIDVLKAQKCKVGGSEWVFPSPTGGPMSPDSVLHMLQRVLKRAGLPRIRFHDLRHTFATMALQNGVDVKTVSSMLGHYSAGFTLDTYAHVTTDAQLKAAQTMGSILSRAV